MTYRYLKLWRWQIPLFASREGGALFGWTGVTVHQIWSRTPWRHPEKAGVRGAARLIHLGHTVCEGKVTCGGRGDLAQCVGYNVRYPHGLLHTSQFRLTSTLPIAYVSFSRWDPEVAT